MVKEKSKKRKSSSSNSAAEVKTHVPSKRQTASDVPSKKRKTKDCRVSAVKRNNKGELIFEDFPEFRPNMTPKEVLQAGSFGGTYFRPIYSSVTKENYKDVWKELPEDWLEGLDVPKQVSSTLYRKEVNSYRVQCGGSLEMWETSGWITAQDPYGWFQWYCRFYEGRRTEDDERQVGRWDRCAGPKGRWRQNLVTKVVRSSCRFDDHTVSPVVRQTLQHWGYRLNEDDYRAGAKRVKPK